MVVVFKWGCGRAVRPDLVRPDRGLDPGDALRHALRPLDGLRGVPRQPDARGVGCGRHERGGGRGRPREDGAARHRRGPDHVRGVHGLRGRVDRRAAAVRLRPRGGDPDRRHDRPLAARAVGDEAVRPLQLVAAGGRGADRARRPVAARPSTSVRVLRANAVPRRSADEGARTAPRPRLGRRPRRLARRRPLPLRARDRAPARVGARPAAVGRAQPGHRRSITPLSFGTANVAVALVVLVRRLGARGPHRPRHGRERDPDRPHGRRPARARGDRRPLGGAARGPDRADGGRDPR